MSDHFKAMVIEKMHNILLRPREVIIEADDLIPHAEELFTKVGSDKSGTSGDEDSFHCCLIVHKCNEK